MISQLPLKPPHEISLCNTCTHTHIDTYLNGIFSRYYQRNRSLRKLSAEVYGSRSAIFDFKGPTMGNVIDGFGVTKGGDLEICPHIEKEMCSPRIPVQLPAAEG